MDLTVSEAGCDLARLRAMLEDALVEADRCDAIVAIHVVTALEALNQRTGAAA